MKWVLLFLALTFPLRAGAPWVTNVVGSQRNATKLVDIRYDVHDPDNDLVKVRVEISDNGGRTYTVPAFSFAGDIGAHISPGTNKLIVWNAGAEWDGEYSSFMKVKIIATDGHGLPTLQWGREVPPGGFLMGQDGGAEGFGPSRHVNIPWSYWLSKFEVMSIEYVEFLNMALAAGEIYRDASHVYARDGVYSGVPGGTILLLLGTDIVWSINKFVVAGPNTNLPAQVSWYGATAFAQFYGYDLPTDAEWEKAARGLQFDGAGEHRVYSWGDSIISGQANFLWSADPYDNNRSPVGYFNGLQTPPGPDMINAYGLYDVIGNVAEWTRTVDTVDSAHENYPHVESLTNQIHSLTATNDLTSTNGRLSRGGSYLDAQTSVALKCYARSGVSRSSTSGRGFRVVRRFE